MFVKAKYKSVFFSQKKKKKKVGLEFRSLPGFGKRGLADLYSYIYWAQAQHSEFTLHTRKSQYTVGLEIKGEPDRVSV